MKEKLDSNNKLLSKLNYNHFNQLPHLMLEIYATYKQKFYTFKLHILDQHTLVIETFTCLLNNIAFNYLWYFSFKYGCMRNIQKKVQYLFQNK